ncbi:MAG: hydrogenase maturation nickel metallochaperone HypA [Kofleriaceae bacterium]
MHELGIAMEIAELAAERAGDAQICRVVVEIGTLAAVVPDALAFAWECMETGAELEIVAIANTDDLRIRQLEVRDVRDVRLL